jgi:hypothetical protein
MAKAFETWTVLRHKPIEKIADNLWMVRGWMPDNRTDRVMTLARRSDGGIVVHNAIALDDEEMKRVEAFGTLGSLVVPNAFHRQDAKIYKQRYPSLRVLCPRGASKGVQAVVPVEGSYADGGEDGDVQLHHLDGVKEREGVMQVRSHDGTTLVFNDVVMNQPKLGFPIGFALGPTGRVSVPRLMRWMVVKDKQALAAHLERLAATPDLKRIIVSHGAVITEKPGDTLRAAAAELRG